MDWTKITDNAEVIKLLKQRTDIENKIKAIDKNALIMHEIELLTIPAVVGQSEQLVSFLRQYQKSCEIMHVNKIDAKNFVEQYKTN